MLQDAGGLASFAEGLEAEFAIRENYNTFYPGKNLE